MLSHSDSGSYGIASAFHPYTIDHSRHLDLTTLSLHEFYSTVLLAKGVAVTSQISFQYPHQQILIFG